MAARFDANIAALANAASKDDTRGALCSVNVTDAELQVTDGHVLIIRPQDPDMPIEPGQYAATAWKSVKPGKSDAVANRVNGSLIVTVPATGKKPESSFTVPALPDPSPFPNVANVIPTDEPVVTFILARDMLKTLLAAMSDADQLELAVASPTVAVRVKAISLTGTRTSVYTGTHGLIMPCRPPAQD